MPTEVKNGKAEDAREVILADMMRHARATLEGEPVVTVAGFEQGLKDAFADRFQAWAFENVGKSRRLRWENLTDWVKAHLTMQEAIIYVMLRGERHIVFCPPIGSIEGHGDLLTKSHVKRLLSLISAAAK
jgi:hypothetical protein